LITHEKGLGRKYREGRFRREKPVSGVPEEVPTGLGELAVNSQMQELPADHLFYITKEKKEKNRGKTGKKDCVTRHQVKGPKGDLIQKTSPIQWNTVKAKSRQTGVEYPSRGGNDFWGNLKRTQRHTSNWA